MSHFALKVPASSSKRPSEEVQVEVHPVPGEKAGKRPKQSTKQNGNVIPDSRLEGMTSAQASALQKAMEKVFSQMAESLTTVLTKTLERFTYKEEVLDGEKDSNLSKPSVQQVRAYATLKPPTSSDHLDVYESVDALLTDVKEPGTDKQSDKGESLGDFLKAVKNDLRFEEKGPPVHEELAKIVTRLVRDGMLEDKLQEKLNKYPQPENCEGLTKVRVKQHMGQPQSWY